MRIISLVFSLFFIFASSIYAQQKPPATPEEFMKSEEARMKQQRGKDLEELKNTNPSAYQTITNREQRQVEINKILDLYNQKKISEEAARAKLEPFVREQIKERTKDIDIKIEQLEKQLSSLKAKQKNPSRLVQEQIDFYLGKSFPQPGEELTP